MKTRNVVLCAASAVLLLAASSSLAYSRSAGQAVYEYLEDNGWEREDLVISSGSYSVSWLWNWESNLRFTSKSQPEKGEMFVELRKSSPIAGWELTRFEQNVH